MEFLLANSTLKEVKVENYDYDILNSAENINMDIQFFLNLLLLIFTIKNLFNGRKWCYERQFKPHKLYCINCNALLVLICLNIG